MGYLYVYILFISTLFIASIHGQSQDCPDHGYKCPTCENKQVCAYPSSFGCEGNVGVPVCKAICPGVICSPIALPCPDECPFNCEYHGPPCCPFLGQPTCLPPCNTLVPCHVTPCPDECKDDCFYPNADRCCPREGQPVCRSELKGPTPSKFTKRSVLEEASPPSTQTKIDGREICVDMIVPCPPECPNDCEYPTDVPCPLTHKPKCRSTTNADQVADHHPEQVDEWMDLLSQEGKLTVPMKEFLMQSHTLLQWVDDQHIMNVTNRPLP